MEIYLVQVNIICYVESTDRSNSSIFWHAIDSNTGCSSLVVEIYVTQVSTVAQK